MRARSVALSARATFAALMAFLALLAGESACDSGGTECMCPTAGLTVTIPQALVGQVLQINGSGIACSSAAVDPKPGTSTAATTFHIEPSQAGQCFIDILFADGTSFSDELTVVETTGCCAGLRTSPVGAAEIDVPTPGDAGDGEGPDD